MEQRESEKGRRTVDKLGVHLQEPAPLGLCALDVAERLAHRRQVEADARHLGIRLAAVKVALELRAELGRGELELGLGAHEVRLPVGGSS